MTSALQSNPNLSKTSLASNIDNSIHMSAFLKQVKIINELAKGVQTLKQFVYPSVLQKEAIPVLRKKKNSKNVIIRYSMMSGVKLTILLPVLDQLLRSVIADVKTEKDQAHHVLILCHSNARCGELEEFIKQITTFCQDIIETVGLYSGDNSENMIALKKSMNIVSPQGASDMKALYKSRCKVFISTPNQALHLLKKEGFKNTKCTSLIVDKIDMHVALDLSSELLEITKYNLSPLFKTIITTNFKEDQKDDEVFQGLKKALCGDQKAIIIQVNDDHRVKSKFERLEHYYALTQTQLDKFVLLFTFIKLGILDGKTVIYTNDIIQAYRIKIFLQRFHLKAFVLSPELPKNQAKSLIHFFHIGQFSIMIVMQSGYSHQPQFKNVQHVVNFDAPEKYNQYKEAGQQIEYDNGSELTLISPDKDLEKLDLYRRKLMKSFQSQNMLKCIPIMWQELMKIKSRVEDVVKTLDNKRVKEEKTNEFKKQLLSNKRLKDYFEKNPQEKEILLNDMAKSDTSQRDRYLFKHLGYLPSYALPQQVMAVTPEQIQLCTVGTQSILSGSFQGFVSTDKNLTGHKGLNTLDGFADASEAQCSLIQNLASLPATIQRYHATQNEVKEQEQDQKDQAFAGEDPAMVNYESLEPTSGRKLWKLRHHKSIKKKLKPHKNGFIGH